MALDIIVGVIGAVGLFLLWRIEEHILYFVTRSEPPIPEPLPPVESRTAKQHALSRPHMGTGTFAPTRGFQ